MTKQASQFTDSTGQAGALEVTPAMIEAGVVRLGELTEAGTSSAYVAEEVFLAMASARPDADQR
jgi:hypothetical protein